jgi:LuxR family transcriptional regulator, maltose regulon positive regulatory protein
MTHVFQGDSVYDFYVNACFGRFISASNLSSDHRMHNSDPLIHTKLSSPFIRPSLVTRPRLQEQIVQGLRGPLTLIIAPAGFGKTTLAISAVACCGMPVAWLSLDPNDNQTGRFLSYVIAAFRTADPAIGNESAQLMDGMQQALPAAVLTSLLNDLNATAREMVLVLDDYQFISSQAVHEQVLFLIEHCPSNLHLLIATRSDPPLPLARLRVRAQMVELRTADLRFTPEEAAHFLNEVMSLQLDAESVAMLEQRTEGWIAGLQMAALSMRDREDTHEFVKGFSGTNRYILDYLLEEILNRQSPEVQRFLLYSSILERLTAPLCDVLLRGEVPHSEGASDHRSMASLEYLDRENLFLTSLDDARLWFRYHHLFADLLRARLHQVRPDLPPLLHIRASAWFEENGFITEAIQHLLAVNEFSQAADLIERYGPVYWTRNDLSVVQMADHLPHGLLVAHPKIGLYRAWLLINQGAIEKVLPLLNDMAQQFADPDSNSSPKWIRIFVRLTLAFLMPPPNTPELDPLPDSQQLYEIPADEPVLRDAADILYGMALERRGETDRAAEVALQCIEREKARQQKPAMPTLIPFLITSYMFQGRLHEVAALCREYLNPIKEKGLRISTAGNLDILLGVVLYEWNCIEESEKYIRDGLQANEPWGNIMTDAFGLLALAHVLQAKGDYAAAMQIVEKFEARLQQQSRPLEFREPFYTLKVRVQLASGDLETAGAWADHVQHSEDFQLHPEHYQLILARIRLLQGKHAEAEKILTMALSWKPPGNRVVRQIETNLLLAAAMAGQRRLPDALALIDSCLALAEPEAYIQVFLDVGEPARELLAAYLRSNPSYHRSYAEKLLDTFSPAIRTDSADPQQAGLIDPLSQRELEVLHLISLGKTNPEIAQHLIIARGTVKAHTASIYRKLDTTNRTAAVARARQLGILP